MPTPRGDRRIIGIGVSVPGLIRESDSVVVAAPNLGWTDTALASLLDEALDVGLPVRVGNDADLGALAESRFGAGVRSDHMLFVTGEVGVGGGFIVGRQSGDGSLRLRRRDRPLPRESGRAALHAAARSAAGRPRSASGRCCAAAGLDEDGGSRAVDELWLARTAADPATLAALAVRGEMVGDRASPD